MISASQQIAFIRQTTYGATGQPTQKVSMPGQVAPSGIGAPSGRRVWNYGGRPVLAVGEIADINRDNE